MGDTETRREEVDPVADRSAFWDEAVQQTPIVALDVDGLRFLVDTEDGAAARLLFAKRRFGTGEQILRAAQVLRRWRLPQGGLSTFFDADARAGHRTAFAVARAGFRDAVALAAHPDQAVLCALNATENGVADRVSTWNAGLGEQPRARRYALGKLRWPPPPTGDTADGVLVEFDTVDALLDARDIDPGSIGLLWVDADLSPGSVLGGATRQLEAGTPVAIRMDASTLRSEDDRGTLLEQLRAHDCRVVDLAAPDAERAGLIAADELPLLAAPPSEQKAGSVVLAIPSLAMRRTKRVVLGGAGVLARTRLQHLVPVDQPLVLISQPPRSGGTLMMRLFDGHPECHTIAHELRLNWHQVYESGRWERLIDRERYENFFRHGFKQTKSKLNLETRTFPIMMVPALDRRIFEDCMREVDGTPTPRDVMNSFFTAHFNAWLDNQNLYGPGKRWVTAFHPRLLNAERHDRSFQQFAETYPDGRMITIVRDPHSWFASSRQWSANYQELDTALERWVGSVKQLRQLFETLGDRLIVLSFEELVSRTEDTMRGLSDRLGIRFTPELCAPTFNRLPIKPNSSFPAENESVMADAASRGDILSEEEAQRIDEIAGSLYEETLATYVRAPVN